MSAPPGHQTPSQELYHALLEGTALSDLDGKEFMDKSAFDRMWFLVIDAPGSEFEILRVNRNAKNQTTIAQSRLGIDA